MNPAPENQAPAKLADLVEPAARDLHLRPALMWGLVFTAIDLKDLPVVAPLGLYLAAGKFAAKHGQHPERLAWVEQITVSPAAWQRWLAGRRRLQMVARENGRKQRGTQ